MEELFSTVERVKILQNVIYKTGKVSAADTVRKLKLSKGLVSKYFAILLKMGILKKTKNGLFVVPSVTVKAVRILLNLREIDVSIFKKHGFVKAAGLYGSCAKGENTEESDVDIWIKTAGAGDKEAASLSSALAAKIHGVKPLFLTTDKLKALKSKDTVFYHSLYFGSILLYGGLNELAV